MLTTHRPGLKPRFWVWRDLDRNETPGIALWGKNGLTAHLESEQARKLADKLHDMADKLDAQQETAE